MQAERQVNVGEMHKQALEVVDRLTTVANEHQRTYPAEVDLVYVFSGPGTYLDKLKPGQGDWQAWMDRDRLRAGVAILREVTASAKTDDLAECNDSAVYTIYTGHDITPEDIETYNKFFMYSGIPIENEVYRRARETKAILKKVPKSKTIIADEIRELFQLTDIAHTGHQYLALSQEITNPNSPIHNIRNIALVAHIPDFIRHVFYAEWLNEQFAEIGREPLNFWFYGLRPRDGIMKVDGKEKTFAEIHMEEELARLEPYALAGHLATTPIQYYT